MGHAGGRFEGDRQPHRVAVDNLTRKRAYNVATKSASQQDLRSVAAAHADTGAC